MSKKLEEEDIAALYNRVWEQLNEDREDIKEAYDELRDHIRGHPTRFIELGDTLAKMGDLRIKQTTQVLEVLKAAQKEKPKEDSGAFSKDELDSVRNAIEEKVKDADK